MSKLVWHTETDGLLCTEFDCLRLTVGLIGQSDHHARFLVFRQIAGSGAGGLIASGTKSSLREAIQAAERVAEGYVVAGRCALVRRPDHVGSLTGVP